MRKKKILKKVFTEIIEILATYVNKKSLAFINELKSDIIYNYIYDNIVNHCVVQIEQGNYDKAYSRYKSSVLTLEEQFAKSSLQQKIVKTLKRTIV